MRKSRLALAVMAGGLMSIIAGTVMAGLWPGFPIVGAPTICWGTTSTATGSLIGVVVGCPNQVPAGPTSLTGAELIPADIYNVTTGRTGNPSTVLLSLASLNALPISIFNNLIANPGGVSATNTSGGVMFNSPFTFISAANVSLPPSPIDGQQYRIASNRTISALNVFSGGTAAMGTNTNPLMLSVSNASSPQGYLFRYDAAGNSWWRLQ